MALSPGQLLGQMQVQGEIRVGSHAPAVAPLASQLEGLAPLPSQALAVQLGAEPKRALQPNQALQSDMVPQGFASVKPGAAVQGPSPEEPDQALADAAAGLSRSPNPAQTAARVSANPFAADAPAAAVPESPGGMQSPSFPSQVPPSLGSNPFGAAAPAPAPMVAELRQRAEAQRGAAAADTAFAAVAAPAAAPQSALGGGRTTVPPLTGGGRPAVAGVTSSASAASSPQPVVGSGGPVPEAAGVGGTSATAIGTRFNVGLLQQRFATVEACTASSACEPGFEREAAAVVDIYAVSLSAGAMGLCSGAADRIISRLFTAAVVDIYTVSLSAGAPWACAQVRLIRSLEKNLTMRFFVGLKGATVVVLSINSVCAGSPHGMRSGRSAGFGLAGVQY